jgi:hypothetical protein
MLPSLFLKKKEKGGKKNKIRKMEKKNGIKKERKKK